MPAKAITIGTISNVPSGMTITPSGSGTTNAKVTVAVTTSMTSLNGIVTIPVTCNGLKFNKQFTYSLSVPGKNGKDGINGTNGINGINGINGVSPSVIVLTQSAYNALGTYNSNTFYVING